ncbi:hypothetical protein [Mucilaginibacter sp.]|uniref:immunity protein Imm33 domain-containing protein n=1 Tax=Mucilaginibacter sp. TaxID=1882438 RepID=UPI0032648F5E
MTRDELINQQKIICEKYGSDFSPVSFDDIVGVALESFEDLQMPVNGLRHPSDKGHPANWYIWCGEYSSAVDFFKPVHVQHLSDTHLGILKYLGLSPGWRFLFDDKGYEDVWFDDSLLLIDK